jgi:transposase
MKPLSMDLRERVVAACDAGGETQAEVADRFAVSQSSVRRLLARRAATGSVAPLPHAGGFDSRVDAAARAVLRDLVAEQPDATLEELRSRLADRAGVVVTVTRVSQVLQELGLPRKKSRTRRPSGTGRT